MILVYSQDCEKQFMQEMIISINNEENNLLAISKATMNDLGKENVNIYNSLCIMNIPQITAKFTKESVGINEVLCMLNTKIEYNEALIISDSSIIGIIGPCTIRNCQTKFYNTNSSYYQSIKPLVLKIREINPDFVFSIYNLNDTYWIVKDYKLMVLTLMNEDSNPDNQIKIMNANEYISKLSPDVIDPIFMLKKRKVISD